MAKRNLLQTLMVLLLMLVVVGLVGHFIVDMSGHEPLPAFGLHAGFILLPFIVVSSALTLVMLLLDDDAFHPLLSLPPLIQPPITLH